MVIFTLEVFVKVLGLGWAVYFKDKANTFDFLIVVVSVTEFIIVSIDIKLKALQALRVLRLLRVFKMA